VDWIWPFVTAGQASNDDPRLNPPDEEIASLTCRRVLVAVAEDTLRERGVCLFARIRDYCARAGGEATQLESEGEDHGLHLYSPARHQQEARGEHRALHQPAAGAGAGRRLALARCMGG
jgi:hypothetical protein